MKLELDWITKEPIDLEHKTYVLMDFYTKVEDEFSRHILYPSFQELSLHLASINALLEKQNLIALKREDIHMDDEILLMDLNYYPVNIVEIDDKIEIIKIATIAKAKFQDLFMFGKSLWSLLYDSVLIKIKENSETIHLKTAQGIFYFEHRGNRHTYQYIITKINEESGDFKCNTKLLKTQNSTEPYNLQKFMVSEDIETQPIFEITVNDYYPIEGSLLTIMKRKIINYIYQSIKIDELKSEIIRKSD